jgi:cysteine-rich repeat protein
VIENVHWIAVAVLLLSVPPSKLDATAVRRAPQHRPPFEWADEAVGPAARHHRRVATQPRAARPAWGRFLAAAPGQWRALWDADLNVPIAILGSGIAAPGSRTDPAAAHRHALAIIAAHLELLAPGTSPDDFVLVANHTDGVLRTLGFAQTHQGMPVVGGQLSALYRNDRLIALMSAALPHVVAPPATGAVAPDRALTAAQDWIRRDFGGTPTATDTGELVVLPLITYDQSQTRLSYATAHTVTVHSATAVGRWAVYIDAHTAAPIARQQLLRFGAGQVFYNVPERWPGANRLDRPALFASQTVDRVAQTSDVSGTVTWTGTADAALTVRTTGPFARVLQNGPELSASGTISDGGAVALNVANLEGADAQVTAFIYANLAKEHLRTLNPGLAWTNQAMQVNVNINDVCNAFSDGDSINFFRAGTLGRFTCENTARLADVVYHEFGHSMHFQSIIAGSGSFDPALSEGIGDYYAATLVNDSSVGRGLFLTDEPLRELNPPGFEATWPDDIDPSSVHTTGLIFGGAMWDLRQLLIGVHGASAGTRLADRLFYSAVQRATDIPSTYVPILAADDDDGNLANGTPNACHIDAAFAAHGLSLGSEISGVQRPMHNDLEISVDVLTAPDCPPPEVTAATLKWRLRDAPSVSGTVAMMENGNRFVGTLPNDASGQVLQYQVQITLAAGGQRVFPTNLADPFYEVFVGSVEPIYCTDFESDPFADGWKAAVHRGVNDWEWGAPVAAGNDPPQAFSAAHVLGNHLAGSGLYSANSTNRVTTPVIDVTGYSGIRLQYRRWLTVEDGFYDRATIYANGAAIWQNLNSDHGLASSTHHTDREWRFHDLDLSAAASSGTVQIAYEIETDPGLEFGGWTIDDFCIVASVPPRCGDGRTDASESCDDGIDNSDAAADACRTDCTAPGCGDGVTDTSEDCDDGNTIDGDTCPASCVTEKSGGGNGDGDGGCCRVGSAPTTGDALLVFAMLAVLARRRRRT